MIKKIKLEKRPKNLVMQNFYLNYHFFLKKFKKLKNLTNFQPLEELPFFPQKKDRED